MATTNGNRPILDPKRWELMNLGPVNATAGVTAIPSRHVAQNVLIVGSIATAWLYSTEQDGYVPLSSPGLGGTFGAGTCGAAGAVSIGAATGAASLTATGGSTSTIVTNQTLARDLRGYSVHITGGPNAGVTLPILSNSIGTNATITVATQASAFTASTTYRLITPVWYVVNAGAIASGTFKRYDWATNTWTTLTQTGLPATVGTDSALITTPSWIGSTYQAFATGTATAGGANTLTNSAKTWTTNQWANYQIRITGGTGAGQVRTVASNTGTQITVSSNWGTNPDATSTYSIEGNDDYIYYIGSGAVTTYRYSISANTWTTLTPTAARAGAPGAGMSGDWVWAATASDWTSESAIINGRRIYSFRGAAGAVLDYYDIAANTWVSGVTYSPSQETFTTGAKYAYESDYIYMCKEGTTARWYRLNVTTQSVDGWSVNAYPSSAATVGDVAWAAFYTDGGTTIAYIYHILSSLNITMRCMAIG